MQDITSHSRIDLHVHTLHSRTAGNWLLDQIQINECYTKPMDVYKIAKSRGMDFVTITDHDVITGALEVAHMPDFFISEEISAFFPDDKTKVHILAYGITVQQHDEIQKLRFNIYELVPYLNEQKIVHALAHPFFKMGPTLTIGHIEQMLLMFEIFEVKNGGKQISPDNLFEMILDQLTPKTVWRLAAKHDIKPVGSTPWKKARIAGSDDHGGIMISSPHTIVKKSDHANDLLLNIKSGQCRVEGCGGSPLAVAHGAMAVGFHYLNSKKKSFDLIKNKLAWKALENIFQETTRHGFVSMALAYAESKARKGIKRNKGSNEWKQITRQLKKDKTLHQFLRGEAVFDHQNNVRFFESINNLVNSHIAAVFARSTKRSDLTSLWRNITVLKNIIPLITPYFVAFRTEDSDRDLMRQSEKQFLPPYLWSPHKVAVFSDHRVDFVLERDEINDLLEEELIQGYDTVYFTLGDEDSHSNNSYSYAPIAVIDSGTKINIPPLLKIAYHFSEENCSAIFVDSIGPMGIIGILLGKLLNKSVLATYHETDVQSLAQKTDGCDSKFFKAGLSAFYSMFDQVRLLDYPTPLQEDILKNCAAETKILGRKFMFEMPDAPNPAKIDIY